MGQQDYENQKIYYENKRDRLAAAISRITPLINAMGTQKSKVTNLLDGTKWGGARADMFKRNLSSIESSLKSHQTTLSSIQNKMDDERHDAARKANDALNWLKDAARKLFGG